MTYAEFLNEAAATALLHKEWRWGQTLYNVLHLVNPNLTAQLLLEPTEAGSPDGVSAVDPYYDDGKVDTFLTWLEEVWPEFQGNS